MVLGQVVFHNSNSYWFYDSYAVSTQIPRLKKTAQRTTDGPTDRRTDRPSYRDAWTHLKTGILSLVRSLSLITECHIELLVIIWVINFTTRSNKSRTKRRTKRWRRKRRTKRKRRTRTRTSSSSKETQLTYLIFLSPIFCVPFVSNPIYQNTM